VNLSRFIGLFALLVGVVLQPIGWMYTHWVTAVSVAAIFVGVLLLLHGREGSDGDGPIGRASGRELPGDIHGHSGQVTGGRSTSWEAHHTSEGGKLQ
jgi:hypothetical protein